MKNVSDNFDGYYLDHEAALLFKIFIQKCIIHKADQKFIRALNTAFAKRNRISLKTISKYNIIYAKELKIIAGKNKQKTLKPREILELYMGENHIWSSYFCTENFSINSLYNDINLLGIDLLSSINKAAFFLSNIALVGEVTRHNEDSTIDAIISIQSANEDGIDYLTLRSVAVPPQIAYPQIGSKTVIRFGSVICEYDKLCDEFIFLQNVNQIFINLFKLVRDHPEGDNFIDYQNFCPHEQEGCDLTLIQGRW